MKQIIKTCPKCGSEFDARAKWGERKFCSRKCSNSRTWTDADKQKKSQSFWASDQTIKADWETRTCACGNTFEARKWDTKKLCSRDCVNKYGPKVGGTGGYREGSGRSRSGYFRGIYCGSTYELCWVIYNLDHGIEFKRFEGVIESENLKYIPDFLIGNRIIEIKGYEHAPKVQAKKQLAESKGYKVDILYREDLQYCFNYVKQQYDTTKFYELYDNYKPKYQYTCANCDKLFETDAKRKRSVACCSRQCAAKYNRKMLPSSSGKDPGLSFR